MTANIAASVESVRVIEEAEVSLLLHVRAYNRGEQAEFATQLHQLLGEAERYATSPEEKAVLAEANVAVGRYLALSRDPNASPAGIKRYETEAIDALELLGDLDVAQTRAAQAQAIRWDRIAEIAAIVLGVSIVGITIALVLWLRRRVIKPLFGLADTMKRFGEGERSVRADESGPSELRDMTHSFNEMAEAIAVQRQAQTAFLGGVAHDLRNPLTAMRLATDMLCLDEKLPPEPQVRKTINLLGRQIANLERMVGDFLDMAKIEAGALELTIAEHDIRNIAREAYELFVGTSRERFHLEMPEEPVMVACDAVRIGQAVANLISNAIKYSPPEEPIDIVVATVGNDVSIAVSDRGVGISADERRRLFEPFRRGATRNTIPGTGLGLYNVQRIVQAHQGRIEVDSVPSVGSTFRIYLTRAAAAAAS
ncbi:MAG TPA: HAMP domain-containing sensor histidine kinase [Kofleriaceae bacterium]|nr:HAMP domain-containing sensor histidine kinase [Kofleriaceae bacterium]